MKAIIYETYGTPDVLQLKEVKMPSPGQNEVLVKVHAASINSWDWDLLRGTPFVNRLAFGILRPKVILGCDIAGRVEAVGENVKKFREGDAVFGDLSNLFSSSGWGGFAEYVCVREDALAPKPVGLTFEQAASAPQAGLLALQALRYDREIRWAQKVLINGASGGVGTFAVQLAKLSGAEVTGVCSTEKMEFVRALGADHVIDYTKDDFTENAGLYDRIVDVQGHHSIFDYKRALAPEGVYVMIGGSSALFWQLMLLGPWFAITEGKKKMGLLIHKANRGLDEMAALLESGKVLPVIDRLYRLEDLPEAMRYYGSGRAKGKVVIIMGEQEG